MTFLDPIVAARMTNARVRARVHAKVTPEQGARPGRIESDDEGPYRGECVGLV